MSRERIAAALPPGGRISLPGTAHVLGLEGASLVFGRVGRSGFTSNDQWVPVAIESNGSRSALLVERDLCRTMIDAALGRPPQKKGPGPLTSGEEGALFFALDLAGGDWVDAGGHRFVLRGILSPGQERDYLGAGEIWCAEGELTLGAEGGGVKFLVPGPVGEVACSFAPPEIGRATEWQVAPRLVVGWTSIEHRDLSGVGPGDLITLDSWAIPGGSVGSGSAFLESGRWRVPARWLDQHRLELVSIVSGRTQMGDTRSGEMNLILSDPAADNRGDMQVEVKVVIGSTTLSVGQALGLVPGRVLRLDRPAGSRVTLVAGESVVAGGELVEHEGRLAVEITEVP